MLQTDQPLRILEPESDSVHTGEHWRSELRMGARTLGDLVRLGFFDSTEAEAVRQVTGSFQMLVSRYYLNLIDRDDPHCPIRLQALPSILEGDSYRSDLPDPIGDEPNSPVPGLVHRYPNRVLFMPTYRCPMFCRYCFRKVALNGDPVRLRSILPGAFNYVAEHPEVEEVILTGGDPLMLSNSRLREVLQGFRAIPHVQRIRIHSRFLVTLPHRVDDELAECLKDSGVTRVVTHFNHPREVTDLARQAIANLRRVGIDLANQAVLLRGVNADPEVLATLYSSLDAAGVRPYYLHHLDAAPGTQHFRVPLHKGLEIYRAACERMDVRRRPSYVLDLPGGLGKVPIDSPTFKTLPGAGQYSTLSPIDGRTVVWVDPAVGTVLPTAC